MPTKKLSVILTLALFACASAIAADTTNTYPEPKPAHPFFKAESPASLFNAGEFALDFAVAYSAAESRGFSHIGNENIRDGDYGLALGGTYWFAKHFGAGVGATLFEQNGMPSTLDQTDVTLQLRYPFERFAPYALVGAGKDWNKGDKSYLVAGGGLEWRFTKKFGAFGETRWLFQGRGDDEFQLRAGVRLIAF